ncbi:MAG TPA: zinc ribbon domain-containing protein [Burkholderiaceae bacterium]|nr:zinc ribbon domain-containing protein [Burkholderiaceae bacterium]
MPIYAYKCAECGHQMDVIRKVSDPPLTECPSCGRSALVKQVTAAGFQLKGAGWYVTDFRDQGSGKKKDEAKTDDKAATEQPADAKAETKSDTKADGGTDSKSVTKPETKTDAGTKAAPAPASSPSPPPASGGKSGGST